MSQVWYPEYVRFIEEIRTTPFAWGTDDCGPAWAGRLVEIVTGVNPVKGKIGKYSTARGALRVMRKLGYENLKDAAAGLLGKPSQHPSTGCIGDLALIKTEDAFGYAFGAVNGERIFFRDENGLGTKDLLEAECIFKL